MQLAMNAAVEAAVTFHQAFPAPERHRPLSVPYQIILLENRGTCMLTAYIQRHYTKVGQPSFAVSISSVRADNQYWATTEFITIVAHRI